MKTMNTINTGILLEKLQDYINGQEIHVKNVYANSEEKFDYTIQFNCSQSQLLDIIRMTDNFEKWASVLMIFSNDNLSGMVIREREVHQ
jgi:hypothetical protein